MQHVGQPHGQLHRHGNRNGRHDPPNRIGIGALQFGGRKAAVRRLEEDVQFDGRRALRRHRRGIVDPLGRGDDAVDAGDDRNLRRRGIAHQAQELFAVGIAQVTLEVLARIPHAGLRHAFECRGMTEDLLLEDRFEHHGSGTLCRAPFDARKRGGIGRTAHHDGTPQRNPQIGRFHRKCFAGTPAIFMPGLPAAASARCGPQVHWRATPAGAENAGPRPQRQSPAHPDRPENGRQNRNPSVTARAWRSMSVVNSSLAFTSISCPVAVSYSSA